MGTTVVGAMFSPRKNRDVHRPRRRLALLPRPRRRDPAAHARPLAHQRLPARDARPHGGAAQRAAEERHHARARHAGPGRRRPPARRPAPGRRLPASAPTASPAWSRTTRSSKIVSSAADIGEACRSLIARANEHGGEDNITAVLIKIEEQPDAPTEEIPALDRSRARSAAPAAAAPAPAPPPPPRTAPATRTTSV